MKLSKSSKTIIFVCAYILGIIGFVLDHLIIFGLLFVFGILFYSCYKKIFSCRFAVVLLSIFVVGSLNSFFNLRLNDDLISFNNEIVKADAKVLTIPSNYDKSKTKFYADILIQDTNSLENTSVKGKSLVTISDDYDKFNNIKIGDKIEIIGKLKIPNYSQNPSQFDYARYLQLKKTFSMIYVAPSDWKIKSNSEEFKWKLLRVLNDKRNEIISLHSRNIKSPMLEVLGGIIFGDDAVNPDEDTKSAFIHSGIFHILAASGMNVTLILGIWLFCSRTFRLNYKISILLGILLIIVYTCMTGFGPPIIRASLMLTLILIGKLIDKNTSTISLLFLVAFIMLLFNPLMLYDVGFQLSFVVTFALIISAPILEFKFKNKILNYILGVSLIPIIAQFYAAPIQMYYFNTFTIYSVFANIAIIPIISIVSFLGFISSILALIPIISDKVCYAADIVLNPMLVYIVNVANFFSTLPNSIVYLAKPSLLSISLYFIIISGVIFLIKYKLFNKKYIWTEVFLIILFALSFVSFDDKTTEIIFFSVENADSILLKSSDNRYYLIDTGKQPYLTVNSQAKNIMVKYFKDNGINELDSLILSHFDSDHAGGTLDILDNIKVKNLYINEVYEDTNLSNRIYSYIKEKGINTIKVNNDTKIYEDSDFEFSIIKPTGELIKTENQKSLIVHCRYKNQNMLFMGDGDKNSYNSLPEKYKQNIAIIKSGHHGGINTIDDNMIKNIDLFIISTGHNIYNHPHPETIAILENNKKNYLRTDYHNAIKVKFNGENYKIWIYSPKYHKFIKYNQTQP